MANEPQSLTIVIPALNEEETIGQTIARCLAESANIKQEAGLTDVEVIVVSDGSTDATAQIARGYDVKINEFEQPRLRRRYQGRVASKQRYAGRLLGR